MRLTFFITGALLSSLFLSCQNQETAPAEPTATLPEPIVHEVPAPTVTETPVVATTETKVHTEPDLERGKKVYYSNCLQCHNKDPNMKGSIGPEQTDTPYDVFEAKVITGRYPENLPDGYTPKRKTKAMRAFPKLKEDIPHIYAWIQSMKK